MKMTKLMAALVVVTIMMTSVVFGATTATTTAYDLDTSKFDVQTIVTGATGASKLTYVLYNGATADESTIKYIDQVDGKSEHTFTVNDIDAADFIGADIIANDDVTDTADTKPVGDYYKLSYGTISNIQTVTVNCDDNVIYLVSGKSTYLPVGKTATIEVFPVAGHALDENSVTEGSVNGNIITLSGEYNVDATVTLNATAVAAKSGKFISVDNAPIIDAVNNTVTFIISTSGLTAEEIAKVGLNVVIAGNLNVALEDMRPASTMDGEANKAFAIQITDTEGEGLVGVNTYTASISFDGTKLDLDAGYYVVPSAE